MVALTIDIFSFPLRLGIAVVTPNWQFDNVVLMSEKCMVPISPNSADPISASAITSSRCRTRVAIARGKLRSCNLAIVACKFNFYLPGAANKVISSLCGNLIQDIEVPWGESCQASLFHPMCLSFLTLSPTAYAE